MFVIKDGLKDNSVMITRAFPNQILVIGPRWSTSHASLKCIGASFRFVPFPNGARPDSICFETDESQGELSQPVRLPPEIFIGPFTGAGLD